MKASTLLVKTLFKMGSEVSLIVLVSAAGIGLIWLGQTYPKTVTCLIAAIFLFVWGVHIAIKIEKDEEIKQHREKYHGKK